MPFICLKPGSIKVIQKLIIISLTAYLYNTFSSIVPSCSLVATGWKIYPFDRKFFSSSFLFMTSAAITIVECDIWPCSTKPHNRLLKFLGELYIMTACIMFVYILFWHPIVIAISICTDNLGVLTNKWLGSTNIYLKSIPICMENVRSTKFHCILLGTLILHNVLDRFGMNDMKRLKMIVSSNR